MAVFPVRGLSKYGIVSDVSPYSLPSQAWSGGVNVRFHNGSVLRAPVFRTVSSSLEFSNPRFVSSNTPTSGFDSVIIGYLDGHVTQWKSQVETDLSVAAFSANSAEVPFSTCHLADVFYVNRNDRVPWSLRTSDSQFQALANWPSTYRANLIRSCNSALIGFGITKAGTLYPTMVKTSEFAAAGTVPANWDPTVTNTNATENILAEMEGGITDAQNLGEIMVIYGLNETWTMTPSSGSEIWDYHKLFSDAGSINANCSVEIDRKHYVFGLNDIWVHDGTTKQSICDQQAHDFIFASINVAKAERCHVVHNRVLKQLHFHFVSGDALVGFSGQEGCNRAAVYDLVERTWTYYDLPFVFGAARANVNTIQTYATVTSTYATIGGTYLDQDDSIKKVVVMVGDVSSTYSLSESLYAFDLQGPGSTIAFPVDTHATKGWTLIRDGIDLDELGADLTGYKVINTIYPQARFEADAQPLTFNVGAADFFNDQPTMGTPQTYDGSSNYKLDFNMPGRWMYLTITHNDWHYVNVTGFDVDLDVLGER